MNLSFSDTRNVLASEQMVVHRSKGGTGTAKSHCEERTPTCCFGSRQNKQKNWQSKITAVHFSTIFLPGKSTGPPAAYLPCAAPLDLHVCFLESDWIAILTKDLWQQMRSQCQAVCGILHILYASWRGNRAGLTGGVVLRARELPPLHTGNRFSMDESFQVRLRPVHSHIQ